MVLQPCLCRRERQRGAGLRAVTDWQIIGKCASTANREAKASRFFCGRRKPDTFLKAKKKADPHGSAFLQNWWVVQGSNLRPSPCKGDALPAELTTREKVGGADGTRTRDPRRDRPVF